MKTILDPNRRNLPILPSFIAFAFWNGLEDRNADGGINSGNDSTSPARNLVSFDRPVTLEFLILECVQKRRLVLGSVSLRSLSGATARPGELYARLWCAFSSLASVAVVYCGRMIIYVCDSVCVSLCMSTL